ncbi:MAG: ATP-binding protein [Deltaproteobacteria bacterium]|nr:ATP-binding protein [Deltaproteobacteria bacterium]
MPQLASLSSLSLTKHAAILGGTGSGKTVLLRRLIEEASLAGIPVLVIDVAGDLTYLGQSWPNPNLKLGDWLEGDLDRAKKYIANANTVVWTPGNSQGNPLYFSSVPDFRGLRDEPMRLQDAQDMALESVLSILKIKLDSSLRKRGIIAAAIGHMAESPELAGAGLNGLRNVLRNMPQDVIDSLGDKTEKMASEMANDLAAAEIVSPELKELSVSDISLLFRGPKGEPRISVVNLNWLNQLDKKLLFVQKILMNVFSWVSRHSGPSLSGLIVEDEAKVVAPNTQEKAPASKKVIRKMAEQLRKYGYGLVLASQALKSLDSAILANCHTVVIGRMNAIADIDECKRHYNIADAKSLGAGEFYIRATGESESSESPFRRIKTALCLSHHPSPSPSESDILRLARASREY